MLHTVEIQHDRGLGWEWRSGGELPAHITPAAMIENFNATAGSQYPLRLLIDGEVVSSYQPRMRRCR